MKKSFSILTAALMLALSFGTAQAEEKIAGETVENCGLPKTVQNNLLEKLDKTAPERRLRTITKNIKNSAVSTKQVIALLKRIPENQKTDAAVKIYPYTCDPQNWMDIYTRKKAVKGIDVIKVQQRIQKLETKPAGFNRTNHPEWYETDDNKTAQDVNPAQDKTDIHSTEWIIGYNAAMAELEEKLREKYNEGYNAASTKADEKYNEGYNKGMANADAKYNNGYNSGYAKARDIFYTKGYNDGYAKADRENTYVQQEPVYNNNNYQNNNRYDERSCGMSESSFDKLCSAIKEASFQSNQEELLKSVAANNTFTADQVKTLIKLMDFPSGEEAVAVIAYPSVCDKGNWFTVYDAFSFGSSKNAVKNALGL